MTFHFCGKFHTDTINQTLFGKGKTSLGKMKTISSLLNILELANLTEGVT